MDFVGGTCFCFVKLFVALPGDTLLVHAKRVEKRVQEETLCGFPLDIPIPLAKFEDKNRL